MPDFESEKVAGNILNHATYEDFEHRTRLSLINRILCFCFIRFISFGN